MSDRHLLIIALTLSLGLGACTGESAPASVDPAATGQDVVEPVGSQAGTATLPPAAATPDAAAMAPVTILTLDREQMADEDCHVMGEVVMGKCDDAAGLAEALGSAEVIKVNTEEMTDALCHYMNGEIMGQCTPDEISSLRYEHTIVYDPATMADEACHAMGNTIMGQCSPEDIQAQAAIIASSW